MTWLATAKSDGPIVYWVFRGNFTNSAGAATTSVVWGTQYAKTSTGLVDARILSLGSISMSLPQTVGSMPESVSCSMTLDNADRALTKYALGTASAVASAEYASDSFLNLKGSIYCGMKDPATGTIYEQRASPTLVVSGPVQIDQSTISLSLASDDRTIFGETIPLLTMRMLKERSSIASGEGVSWSGGQRTHAGVSSAYTGANASDHLAYVETNLDKVVPWLYGTTAIPCTPGTEKGGQSLPTYVVGVTKEEPSIADFEKWQAFIGTHADRIAFENETEVNEGTILYKTKRTVTYDAAGSTVDVWVLLLGFNVKKSSTVPSLGGEFTAPVTDWAAAERFGKVDLYLVPSKAAQIGIESGQKASAAGLVRQLIKDHGGGTAKIDATSYARAHASFPDADRFGGLVRTQAPLAGLCEYVCRPGSINLWLGKDDTLRFSPASAWSPADVTAAATDLPHLREVDVLGGYSETVPRDPGEQGAAAKTVAMAWSDAQRDFWEADQLFDYAPGSSSLPIAGAAELELPGDWVFPPTAEQTMVAVGGMYAFVTRRISFVTHLWVGLHYELGQLFRLTHPLAAGLGDGSGYAYRLVRLEAVDVLPSENAARVTFEDLGPVAAVKPAVLDNIANWIRYDPTGGTDVLSLTNGSAVVTATTGTPFATAQVGDHLWTFGANNALNRRSRRITAVTSSTQVTVEYAYSANQMSLAASTAGTAPLSTNWIVMKTQGTQSPTNTTKLTACNEQTGNVFRDGTTAGFQCSGG